MLRSRIALHASGNGWARRTARRRRLRNESTGGADRGPAEAAGGLSRREENGVLRRQDRAQQRFLAAVKALAQVRKLLQPSARLQVNIAQQQVNGVSS